MDHQRNIYLYTCKHISITMLKETHPLFLLALMKNLTRRFTELGEHTVDEHWVLEKLIRTALGCVPRVLVSGKTSVGLFYRCWEA